MHYMELYKMKKIQRKRFFDEHPDFIRYNARKDSYNFPEIYNNYRLSVSSKSARGHAKLLATEWVNLFKKMGCANLYFIGQTNIPWLFRTDNDYVYVINALTYLRKNGISKTFNGAIKLNINELYEFAIHLYWLVRCNGILAYVDFIDEDNNLMGNICQYGSLHLNTLNKDTDGRLNEVLSYTDFKLLGDESCEDPFSATSRIPHRNSTIIV